MRRISAIQPTGTGVPHLGNYLGVLKSLPSLLNDDSYIFVADIHSTTVPYEVADMKKAIHNTTAMLMACGVPSNIIFQQSQVLEHYILSTLLTHITPLGVLERMTQYKDKKEQVGVLTGLLTYPVLMAADILLYDIEQVPVGHDQLQHIQLTRELAEKFNSRFGNIMVSPEPHVLPFSRVASLNDGTKKMSKSSANQSGIIYLDEDMKTVSKKYKKAETDSEYGVRPDGSPMSPSVENLVSILSSMTGRDRFDICREYGDQGYGVLKKALIEAHEEFILPIQEEYKKISIADTEEVLKNGSDRAREYASVKLVSIKKAMGL